MKPDTRHIMSEFAGDFLYEYGARDLSYEELEELMEEHAKEEEADDMILSDYRFGNRGNERDTYVK